MQGEKRRTKSGKTGKVKRSGRAKVMRKEKRSWGPREKGAMGGKSSDRNGDGPVEP